MFSFVSYLSYKTTTFRPAAVINSRTVYSSSSSREISFTANTVNSLGAINTNVFSTWSNEGGETIEAGLTSRTASYVNPLTSNGETYFTKKSANSSTISATNENGSFSQSGELTPQRVTNQTTTKISSTTTLRTTQTTQETSFIWTTTKENDSTVFTQKSQEISSAGTGSFEKTIEVISVTSLNTSELTTFTDWSKHQIVVADTIIEPVPPPFGQPGDLAIICTKSEFEGINNFSFLKSKTTISWNAPLSTENSNTRSVYTSTTKLFPFDSTYSGSNSGDFLDTESSGEVFKGTQIFPSETTVLPSSTTTTFSTTLTTFTTKTFTNLSATFETVECENWQTFNSLSTTTNSSSSGTIMTTFFSSNSEEKTEWSTGVSNFEGTTTSTTTSPFTETIWQNSTTRTLETTFHAVLPSLKLFSENLGVYFETSRLPWQSIIYPQINQIFSLDSSTKLETSTSTSEFLFITYTKEYNWSEKHEITYTGRFENIDTQDGGYIRGAASGVSKTEGGTTSSVFLTGTYYSTSNNNLLKIADSSLAQLWKTALTLNNAAPANLEFTTEPTRFEGFLYLGLDGNQHTLHDLHAAEISPKEWVMPFYPSFTTLLSINDCGFGAHPSAWSTMTLSREAESFFSSWRYLVESNNSGKTFATSSRSCKIVAEKKFPFGVQTAETSILGGNMQPNSGLVTFHTPGVFLTCKALPSGTESGFSTNSNSIGIEKIQNVSAITLRRNIPYVAGKGIFKFSLLDDGMP